jgi:hypothetical protein
MLTASKDQPTLRALEQLTARVDALATASRQAHADPRSAPPAQVPAPDQASQILLLTQQVLSLQQQLLQSQTASKHKEDDGYATEDTEESCQNALRHWKALEQCLEPEERCMGAFVATEMDRSSFLHSWSERLRLLPSSPSYLGVQVARQLARLRVAFDLAGTEFGDTNARLEYKARSMLRLTLEESAQLMLQLSGITAEGCSAFFTLLTKHRRQNRARKTGYVGLDAIVTEVRHSHSQKKGRGSSRSRRQDYASTNKAVSKDDQGPRTPRSRRDGSRGKGPEKGTQRDKQDE